MFLSSERRRTAEVIVTLSLLVSCGAKDIGQEPQVWDELVPATSPGSIDVGGECSKDADCAASDRCFPRACVKQVCVAQVPVVCDDTDPCTADRCVPQTGACEFTDRTLDADGDGQRAPLPGLLPTDPDACGTDCNDANPSARQGGTEVCDGVDNNCDGIIDEGHSYVPNQQEPILLSPDAPRADLGGMAFNGNVYVVSLAQALERNQTELVAVDASGALPFRELVARTNSDSYPGPLESTGFELVSAWEDRRDDDFEIYFNRFDLSGRKLGPDLRLSNARGFSLGASLLVTSQSFVVTWADQRNTFSSFNIYGQVIPRSGELAALSNINLTPDIGSCESASLAAGPDALGFVCNADEDQQQIYFRQLSNDLLQATSLTKVAVGVGPSIQYVAGRYVIFWHQYDVVPGDALWGAVLDPNGSFVVPPRRVTAPAPFARGHSALNLGDRILFAWAEYQVDHYEIWTQMLDAKLEALTPSFQVTVTQGDALNPVLAFGKGGEVGVAYTRHVNGGTEVRLTTLGCN